MYAMLAVSSQASYNRETVKWDRLKIDPWNTNFACFNKKVQVLQNIECLCIYRAHRESRCAYCKQIEEARKE